MSDPFESFKSVAQQEIAENPLPATEVRRRGDRMRRRNGLAAAAGAIVAVLVVATPLAMVAAGRDDGATPTSPSTTEPTWATTIPDGFPLETGFPAPAGSEYAFDEPSEDNQSVFAAGDISACETAGEPGDFLDRLTTRLSGPEDLRERELLLYADDETAESTATGIRDLYEGCPEQPDGGPGTITTTVRDLALGDDALTVQRAFSGVGTTVIHVVRVGNAVLLDLASDEGTDVEAKAAETERELGGVVEAMEEFSGTAAALSGTDLITVEQVPTRDRLGAWRETRTTNAPTLACQPEPLSVLDADVVLTREFQANIAGIPASEPASSAVNTAVLQFDDDAAATAAYDTVASWIKDCAAPAGGLEPYKYAEFVQPEVEGGRGEWRHRSFLAPDVCTDCDATRFHRMGVAQLGDRLALVELAEVGGPLEPEFLKQTMTDLFAEVVAAAPR